MMCLKPPFSEQDLRECITESSRTVPLVVKFSSGCVPLGCFGSTISCLLSKYGWEVIQMKDGTPKFLGHNVASLYDPDTIVDVLLVDFSQHVEVHVTSDLTVHKSPADICRQVLRKIFGAVKKVFEVMHLDGDRIKFSPAVFCSCSGVRHFAEFAKDFLRCSESTVSKPDPKQALWMGKVVKSGKPELPELLELKIPERVGKRYTTFGIHLLQDTAGDQVHCIEENCHFQIEQIVLGILRCWVRTRPTAVTWENLEMTLRKCGLTALADDVHKFHNE